MQCSAAATSHHHRHIHHEVGHAPGGTQHARRLQTLCSSTETPDTASTPDVRGSVSACTCRGVASVSPCTTVASPLGDLWDAYGLPRSHKTALDVVFVVFPVPLWATAASFEVRVAATRHPHHHGPQPTQAFHCDVMIPAACAGWAKPRPAGNNYSAAGAAFSHKGRPPPTHGTNAIQGHPHTATAWCCTGVCASVCGAHKSAAGM